MCLINSLAIFCLIQMIMLSSLSDLLRFIDENQLNTEFGGNLEQCHSDWIVLRTVSFLISRKENDKSFMLQQKMPLNAHKMELNCKIVYVTI